MKRKLWKLVIPALLVIALIGYTAISAQGEFVQASYEIELQKPAPNWKTPGICGMGICCWSAEVSLSASAF